MARGTSKIAWEDAVNAAFEVYPEKGIKVYLDDVTFPKPVEIIETRRMDVFFEIEKKVRELHLQWSWTGGERKTHGRHSACFLKNGAFSEDVPKSTSQKS